jgi:hypothetical protein
MNEILTKHLEEKYLKWVSQKSINSLLSTLRKYRISSQKSFKNFHNLDIQADIYLLENVMPTLFLSLEELSKEVELLQKPST